jgi:hypothetical protein
LANGEVVKKEKDFLCAQQLAGSKRCGTGHFSNFTACGGVAIANAGIQHAIHGSTNPVNRVLNGIEDFGNEVAGF